MSIYADDTTVNMSATTVDDLSVALNKELHQISDWVMNKNFLKHLKDKVNCVKFKKNITVNPQGSLSIG